MIFHNVGASSGGYRMDCAGAGRSDLNLGDQESAGGRVRRQGELLIHRRYLRGQFELARLSQTGRQSTNERYFDSLLARLGRQFADEILSPAARYWRVFSQEIYTEDFWRRTFKKIFEDDFDEAWERRFQIRNWVLGSFIALQVVSAVFAWTLVGFGWIAFGRIFVGSDWFSVISWLVYLAGLMIVLAQRPLWIHLGPWVVVVFVLWVIGLLGIFADQYFALARLVPGSFPIEEQASFTNLDAVYVSVTTFTSLGSGSIQPIGSAARRVVTLESITALITVAVALSLVVTGITMRDQPTRSPRARRAVSDKKSAGVRSR